MRPCQRGERHPQVGNTPCHRSLHSRDLDADGDGVRPGGAGRVRDAAKGWLQDRDAAALRRPAQRPEPVVAQAQRGHPGGERRGLST